MTTNPLAVLMKTARKQAGAAPPPARGRAATPAKKPAPFRFVKKNTRPGYVPFYKRIPATPFTVDAFQYSSSPTQQYAWVLTHFHSDHYGGLSKDFNDGLIYCTPATAALVHMQLRVPTHFLRPIPLNKPTVVHDVELTMLDANHCPGAAMVLFRLKSGKVYLHVGDFRWCPAMTTVPALRAVAAGANARVRLDALYLDTTYCGPQYQFPTQTAAVAAVHEMVELHGKDPGVLFLFGSYSIGKEKVFMECVHAACTCWLSSRALCFTPVERCAESPGG